MTYDGHSIFLIQPVFILKDFETMALPKSLLME